MSHGNGCARGAGEHAVNVDVADRRRASRCYVHVPRDDVEARRQRAATFHVTSQLVSGVARVQPKAKRKTSCRRGPTLPLPCTSRRRWSPAGVRSRRERGRMRVCGPPVPRCGKQSRQHTAGHWGRGIGSAASAATIAAANSAAADQLTSRLGRCLAGAQHRTPYKNCV